MGLRTCTAVVLVALSSLIATVLQIQQQWSPEHAQQQALWSLEHTQQHSPVVTIDTHVSSAQDGTDAASYIQSRVTIMADDEELPKPKSPSHQITQAPIAPLAKQAPPKPTELLATSYRAHFESAVNLARKTLHASSISLLEQAHRVSTTSVGGMCLVVLVMLMLFLVSCMMLGSLGGNRRTNSSAPLNKDASSSAPAEHPAFLQEVMRGSSRGATPLQSTMRTPGPRPSWSPLPSSHAPVASLSSLSQLPSSLWAPEQPSQPAEVDRRELPPPLCPNVILPNCEVRVGIPMHELGRITSEGDLNIVGLSGNPLLRAALRKTEAGRTLEISMPEPRSAPRAIVGPSFKEVVGMQGKSRAVQILGMKGAFYGMLEMRSSGACYVIKDGQTVLAIDGDSDKLHLTINSGLGSQLATVTCSSEPFHGAEHLEVRVQPGVDTVLVLACVLAVVLLSPYPPSES